MRVLLVAGLGWFLVVGAFAWMLCRAAALGDLDLEPADGAPPREAATAGVAHDDVDREVRPRPVLVAVAAGRGEELAVLD